MSFLWHGLTDAGAQVPIQVDAQGRVIAVDGTPGTSNWENTGTQLYPLNNEGVLVGGTLPSSPNISLNVDGSANFAGSLGVGTSTPNYLLDVEQANAGARINALTGNSSLYLTCEDNAGISTLFLGDATSPTTGQIKYRNTGDNLAFEVNGSERLRIGSDGQFGFSGANYGISGQVLTSSGPTSAPTWQTPSGGGGGLYEDYAFFQHTAPSGSSGGATATGIWNVRPINTTVVSQTWASVTSNQISLNAGTYSIEWSAVISRSGFTQSRLRNITSGTTVALGLSLRSDDGGGGSGFGQVTVASPTTFELQHYTASNDGAGLGQDAGSGESNVYAIIKIYKHA